MVFISMAWGAGISLLPKPKAWPIRITVAATAQQATDAPMSWPNCCLAGVAPTRNPVFRSWEMSPALEAAMATMVPTVSTAARAPPSTHPAAAKMEATPSSVTRVMPEVGWEETPTMPTMRAATATKSTPKTPTPAAQTMRGTRPMFPAKIPGTKAAVRTTKAMPPTTKDPGRSRSVSKRAIVLPDESRDTPLAMAAKAPTIVGRFLSTVRMPAVATAPAPM